MTMPTTNDERRAPVQGDGNWGMADGDPRKVGSHPPGTVAWAEHLEAYVDYSRRYGTDQSAERLAERGGFGYSELTDHLGHEPKTWKPR